MNRHRFVRSARMLAVATALASVAVAAVGAQAPAAAPARPAQPPARSNGPAPSKPAKPAAWNGPNTPWGDPDLQGVWNDATSTPLARPGGVGDKDVLTDDEAAGFEDKLAYDLTRDRRDGGAAIDVNRAYNENWMDARRLKITADHRTSLIIDPPDGRIPPTVPISEERRKVREERALMLARFNAGMPYAAQDMSLPIRCIIRTDSPPYLPLIYNNDFQIFQSPGYVVIAPEMIHSARVIPLDGRPHISKNLKQWLGDSRGHFEGKTLVIETTNFRSDYGVVFQNADPATYKITERFTRVSADRIDYQFTVEDPHTWTRPWTAMIPWNRIDPAEQMYEYSCHEDNYDIVHLLSGGRNREKKGEKAPTAPARGGGGGEP